MTKNFDNLQGNILEICSAISVVDANPSFPAATEHWITSAIAAEATEAGNGPAAIRPLCMVVVNFAMAVLRIFRVPQYEG